MQDDFRLCPLALLALQHVVRKVSRRDAEWLSVRVSFGLAGVLVRNDNHDLQRLEEPGTSPNEPPRPPNPNANVPTRCRGRILRSS